MTAQDTQSPIFQLFCAVKWKRFPFQRENTVSVNKMHRMSALGSRSISPHRWMPLFQTPISPTRGRSRTTASSPVKISPQSKRTRLLSSESLYEVRTSGQSNFTLNCLTADLGGTAGILSGRSGRSKLIHPEGSTADRARSSRGRAQHSNAAAPHRAFSLLLVPSRLLEIIG